MQQANTIMLKISVVLREMTPIIIIILSIQYVTTSFGEIISMKIT